MLAFLGKDFAAGHGSVLRDPCRGKAAIAERSQGRRTTIQSAPGKAQPQRRSFSISGDPDAIAPVMDDIMRFIRAMECAHGSEMEVELALQEALANAIVHGCKGESKKSVQCVVTCHPASTLEISVQDPGNGFNPNDVQTPCSNEGLAMDHGRGLHLIRSLMDEVRFSQNGTELIMRKG
jgi:serine/threonine-protein kinase RsbW